MRNQLAHEVGAYESGILTDEDLDFVLDFHGSIINREDPLALVYQYRHVKFEVEEPKVEESSPKKSGLFFRIKEWLRSLFS